MENRDLRGVFWGGLLRALGMDYGWVAWVWYVWLGMAGDA